MRRGPGDKGEQAGRFTSDGSLSQNICLEGCREGPGGVGQGNELSGSAIGEEEEFPLHREGIVLDVFGGEDQFVCINQGEISIAQVC